MHSWLIKVKFDLCFYPYCGQGKVSLISFNSFQIAYFCFLLFFNDIYLKPYNMIQLLFSTLDLLCNILWITLHSLHFLVCNCGLFLLIKSLQYFFSALLLVVNCFYFSGRVFLACSFLKDIFTGKITGWGNLILALPLPLASIVF